MQDVPIEVVLSGGGGEEKRKRGRPRKHDNCITERKAESKAEPRILVNVALGEGVKKRKRGRPRKNETQAIQGRQSEREMALVDKNVEEKEMVMVNEKGEMVDVAALGNVEDPYGEELKRRTEGLQTKAELLGFLTGLSGEWWSKSRKKRVVLASDFGHAFPKGWKLMLSVKKRADRVWLHCRRYISPNGRQFVSCKEVSSYLCSFRIQDTTQPRSGHADDSFQVASKAGFGDDAVLNLEDGKNADGLVSCLPPPRISTLTDYANQDILKSGTSGVETGKILNCHQCTRVFEEKNDLVHHLVSSHSNTANRCKCLTSTSDGVVIKDGKYEFQLCDEVLEESHHCHGHIGVHMRSYVKSVEASGGLISTQKSVDPCPTGVLPSTSKVYELIGIDRGETFVVEPSDESSSGHSRGMKKADSVVKTCGDVDCHAFVLLSHDKETRKVDRDGQALDEKLSDERDRICNVNDDNFRNVDAVSVVGNRWKPHSENETASNKENISICESSGGTNILNFFETNSCVAESRSSESWLIDPPGNERTFAVQSNVISEFFQSVEEQKLEIGSESGLLSLNGKRKTRSGEDGEDKSFSGTAEDMKVDGGFGFENNELVYGFGGHDSGLKDVCADAKQQCSKEVGSEERSTDERTFVIRDNVGYICTSTLVEPRFDGVTMPGNSMLTSGSGNSNASQVDKGGTSRKKEGSAGNSLLLSSWNKYILENNSNQNSCFTMEGSFPGKSFQAHEFAPSVSKQISGFDNNMSEVSTGAVEGLHLDDVRNCNNNEINVFLATNETEVEAGINACSEQERRFKGSFLVSSADEHRCVLQSNICNSPVEGLKQVTGLSEIGLFRQPAYEDHCDNINNVKKVSFSSIEEAENKKVKSSWNTEKFLAFGTQAGLGADVASTTRGQNFEGCSLVLSGDKQTFSTDNMVTGVCGSTGRELKRDRGSENSFPCSSAFEQVENRLNRISVNIAWEQARPEDVEKPRDDESMTNLGNHVQSNEDVMSELMWRTKEQNIKRSGLANTSSPLVQSSGCFPNFDVTSSKGGDKIFRANKRFDSKSGLEELRSISTGNLEYNFLTTEESCQQEESKGLSCDAEMEQGFDSSYWLEKEALPLLPQLASRHQVRTVCVWCTKEFYLESVNSGMQSGSVGFMCATCNAKFSGQFHLQ